MRKVIACLLLVCILHAAVAPAYAGAIPKNPVTQSEDADLAAQQAEDAPELAEVAAGDGLVVVLAVVGIVLLVLVLTGELD